MARIELTAKSLVVHIEGFDRILALKSQVEVPLSHVMGAQIDPDRANKVWAGLKTPGTHLPGLLTEGSFWQAEGWVFFDVHDIKKAISICLTDEHYRQLVVEVAEPVSTVAAIQQAIGKIV